VGALATQASSRTPPKLARYVSFGWLARGRWPAAGLRISGFQGLRALRLELAFRSGALVRAIHVTAQAGDRDVASWVWRAGARAPSGDPRTVVLRPGKPSDGFRPTGKVADADQADRVEVCVEVMPGARAGVTVRRAAYVR
jgi:hypothetical protein